MTSSTTNYLCLFRLARQLMLGVILLIPMAAALAGAGLGVTNTNDSGPGSLRQAMLDALADPGADEITFAPSANGVITLASPLPDLLTSGGALTMAGNGVDSTIIDGDGQFRFFHSDFQDNLTLSLRDMTLRNGRAEGSQGGAIRVIGGSGGTVNVDTVRFLNNSASFDGGAIHCVCTLNIDNSTFSGNVGGANGGALSIVVETTQVSNSTLVGNQAGAGAAIHGAGSNVDIRLVNTTITGNRVASAIHLRADARLSMSNTLVAGNPTPRWDLAAVSGAAFEVADSFNNVIGTQNGAGFVDGQNGNQVGITDPRVGPLGDYGGPIPTAPLLPGSPAIDAGTDAVANVPAVDQRGLPRVGAVDVGAFESQGFNLTLTGGNNQSARVNTGFADSLAFLVEANVPGEPVAGGVVPFTVPAAGASAVLSDETVTIDATGTGQVLATANGTVGGPYPVTASTTGGGSIDFMLSNTPPPGITVDPVSGLATTEAGGSDNFTVVLEAEPASDVTIPVASSNTGEGTVSTASLVFTAADWDSPQTVTVTGVDDSIVDGDQAYTIQVGPVDSADAGYDGLDPADVSVTNIDDDSAGMTVDPTGGLTTTEAGGSNTFTVMLNSEPTADVSIALASDNTDEGTIAPASLVFTTDNWNQPQTVTITGVDDAIVDGDIAYTIFTDPAASADPNYDGLDPADVSVTNIDDDSAGITVDPATGLTTTEAGGTATFTVVLNSEPAADVSIALASDNPDEGTVAPAAVTFSAADWNTPQTVTVTGVDDEVADGDIAYTIVTDPANSGDPNYDGLDPADVSVTNTDDDSAGITVDPTDGLTTTEAGGTATFTVVLNSEPIADVSIALASDNTDEGTVTPAAVTFSAADWKVPQDVVVTGVDDEVADGDIAYTIVTDPASSADPNYDGIDAADVPVTNTDDDSAGITVDPTDGLTTTEAGGTATFTITLNSEPAADVTVPLASDNTDEGTVSPASITFTAGNRGRGQTVTVTGMDDEVADGDTTYTIVISPASSGDPDYDDFDPADVSVTNTDDDSAGITVDPTDGLETGENGDSDTFTVVLNTQPGAEVTVPLSSDDSGEGTVEPDSLVFNEGNWDQPQAVAVTGVDDDEVDGDIAYQIEVGPASSGDEDYNDLGGPAVNVTNIDDEVPGAVLTGSKEITELDTDAGTVSYLITLTNTGDDDQPDDPEGDEFVDILPDGLALTAATADAGELDVDLDADTVTWNGELPAGDSIAIVIDADIVSDQAGAISNQGRIHYDSSGDGSNDAQALTDDPSLPGDSDPTNFQIQGTEPPAIPIPAASLPVWLLLAGLVLVLGIGAQHRRVRKHF